MGFAKMPEVKTNEVTAAEYIVAFYKALGWNNEQLHPNRVQINRQQWLEICQQLEETDPNAGLILMNYGPSGVTEVPFGKVKLQKGWLTD